MKKINIKLSKKEIKSLMYIVANHYPCEKFDDKNSHASILFSKLNLISRFKCDSSIINLSLEK